ncbi:expressed unknown protein [Seminavis robusta]|uniref:Uncharacterized protein n=1 Tax=Seminavis robusta TaxID=568900 RepID=A0A9N8DGN2_9STRA|nr:expressed unknown protein [Seminavis robusta]|eukprot:Sro133_g062990.1 n/a (231) ;mRNA; r:42104-42796
MFSKIRKVMVGSGGTTSSPAFAAEEVEQILLQEMVLGRHQLTIKSKKKHENTSARQFRPDLTEEQIHQYIVEGLGGSLKKKEKADKKKRKGKKKKQSIKDSAAADASSEEDKEKKRLTTRASIVAVLDSATKGEHAGSTQKTTNEVVEKRRASRRHHTSSLRRSSRTIPFRQSQRGSAYNGESDVPRLASKIDSERVDAYFETLMAASQPMPRPNRAAQRDIQLAMPKAA